jgi:hypothetical protein
VSDPDDLDAKAEERALAAAEAGCARLLELLRRHHPEMNRPAAWQARTGLLRLRKVSTDNDYLQHARHSAQD